MVKNHIIIPILLPGESITLEIFGVTSSDLVIKKEDAFEHGEANFQILEGSFYEFKISPGYHINSSEVITQSKVNTYSGRISPNIFVGTITLEILNFEGVKCTEVGLEVRSVKASYREDYRHMLEDITEKCADLVMQHSTPASQFFEIDFNVNTRSLYQRFAFIKSVIDSEEFNDSIQKIILSPVTNWKSREYKNDIRAVKRFNSLILKQFGTSQNRTQLPPGHPLKSILTSIPSQITLYKKTESVDTAENRFIKHVLESLQFICSNFALKFSDYTRIKNESIRLVEKIDHILSHSIFKEVTKPTILNLNSPILQRKEGYREIFRSWLILDCAAKLVWHGGDDVYRGNKRDVAVLYEYWLFFKMLDLMEEIFDIKSAVLRDLFQETKDGLGLQLKQGEYFPVEGVYKSGSRKLNITFSYNRTFSGNASYPLGGSWTKSMRPDYTLSIWPFGIDSEQAEIEELISHIHFDAKYKIENLSSILGVDDYIKFEKEDQRKGTYKRADLLKMHSYKDAIRRTAGAYIIYPGNDDAYTKIGFHEIIPGLGAFAIRPSKTDNGIQHLKTFINEVISHFMNRASQREKISVRAYENYKSKPDLVTNPFPENSGINRGLLPDETYVLIGYYNKQNWDWITKMGLYNARADGSRGSLKLGPKEVGAKYLLLHSETETRTNKLFNITEIGPRIFSKQGLVELGYPSEPSQNSYLVYKVKQVTDIELIKQVWDISFLDGYVTGRAASLPFSVTFAELMRASLG